MVQTKKQIRAYYAKKTALAKKKRKIRGKGDYVVDPEINKSLKSIGRTLGQYFGQGDLGENLANVGHRVVKQITGYGDYNIKSNTVLSGQTPLFGDGKASVRIQHREFFRSISSSIDFVLNKYPVQPGNNGMFPWLSQVADNYQEYKINGMIFEYVSRSADALNSTNTALGSLLMAVEYNALSPDPTNKQEMLNYEFSGVSKPSENLMVPLECDRGQSFFNNLFIRTKHTPQTSIGDLRLYDYANLYIATQGSQAVADIGDLYVTYDISLYKAKLPKSATSDHFEFADATTSNYFGLSPELQSSSNFGCTLTNDRVTFPDYFSGQVMIHYRVFGDSTSNVAPVIAEGGKVTPLNVLNNDTLNESTVNATSTVLQVVGYWNIEQATISGENYLSFSLGTLPANPQAGDLIIAAISLAN